MGVQNEGSFGMVFVGDLISHIPLLQLGEIKPLSSDGSRRCLGSRLSSFLEGREKETELDRGETFIKFTATTQSLAWCGTFGWL